MPEQNITKQKIPDFKKGHLSSYPSNVFSSDRKGPSAVSQLRELEKGTPLESQFGVVVSVCLDPSEKAGGLQSGLTQILFDQEGVHRTFRRFSCSDMLLYMFRPGVTCRGGIYIVPSSEWMFWAHENLRRIALFCDCWAHVVHPPKGFCAPTFISRQSSWLFTKSVSFD